MTNVNEIWKVLSHNTNYQFSNLGNVKYNNGKVIKNITPLISDKGYRRLSFYTKERNQTVKVCRIIGELFVQGKTETKNEINHIDGDKLNDAASNLEWTDRSGNIKHAFKLGLCKAFKSLDHNHSTICLHTEYGYFCTMKEAAEIAGKQRSNMRAELCGRRKNTTKFILA
jgi:hypothetical protein